MKEDHGSQRNGPPKISKALSPEPLSITNLFGRRAFADGINVTVLRQGDYSRLSRQALNVATVSL